MDQVAVCLLMMQVQVCGNQYREMPLTETRRAGDGNRTGFAPTRQASLAGTCPIPASSGKHCAPPAQPRRRPPPEPALTTITIVRNESRSRHPRLRRPPSRRRPHHERDHALARSSFTSPGNCSARSPRRTRSQRLDKYRSIPGFVEAPSTEPGGFSSLLGGPVQQPLHRSGVLFPFASASCASGPRT
jgi:hypothetical protein